MQYYVLKEKLQYLLDCKVFFDNMYLGVKLDDFIWEKCPMNNHIILKEFEKADAFPTRNIHLISELCRAFSCTSRDFTLFKHEEADESTDIKEIEKQMSAPLDYDITHFRDREKRHYLHCTDDEYKTIEKRLTWERTKEDPNSFIDIEDYVFDTLANFPPGEPIFLDILFQKCNNRIKSVEEYRKIIDKLVKNNPNLKIRRYNHEVYYRTVNLTCLDMSINLQNIVPHKYMQDYGWYYTGYDLLNRIGLSAMMPKYTEIASNSVDKDITDDELMIKVYVPKTHITEENRLYLLINDVLEMIDNPCINSSNPYDIIRMFISDNRMCPETLYEIADKFYPEKVAEKLEICLKDSQ